ncbi:MAG: DUF1491 family protein [Pseudomonadota bacterium]
MRLTSEFWVAAYIRRVQEGGAHAMLAKRGAREAGAIHLRIVGQGGERLLSPAPMSLDGDGTTRQWSLRLEGSASEIDAVLASEMRFDEDAWVVDVEDRSGRDFLEDDERGD